MMPLTKAKNVPLAKWQGTMVTYCLDDIQTIFHSRSIQIEI